MEIRITRNESQDLTILEVAGIVSKEEMFSALERLYQGTPTTLILWDMSLSDVSDVETGVLADFAKRAAVLGVKRKNGRTAIFAPHDLHFGLARMSEVFADMAKAPFKFKVFRSRQEALDWLLA